MTVPVGTGTFRKDCAAGQPSVQIPVASIRSRETAISDFTEPTGW
jgi:hypothetical protein